MELRPASTGTPPANPNLSPGGSADDTPQQEVKTRRRWFWRLLPLFLLVVLALNGGLVWLHQDQIKDWATLRNYQPTEEIAQLSSETTMTDYGRRLFYVNKPALEERDAFNSHCRDVAEKEAAVLGCFVGDRQGIFVYNITDPRLAGIKQVTAAHEMLHQAYIRLNANERRHLDTLLQDYAKTVTDPKMKDKIALYKQTEPYQVINELHSIFGTEVAELPDELEIYYKQYFNDRQKVVGYYKQYRTAFDARTAQIAKYDQQLADLRKDIDQRRTDIDTREQSLQADRAQLDTYLARDQIGAYNAAVPPYNAAVAAYRQAVAEANDVINRYNDLIDARNAIAVEEQELLQAQDSNAL